MQLEADGLAAIRQGAILGEQLPYLEGYVQKMLKSVEIRAYTAINSDHLSPEKAQALWFEHKTAHDLLQKMKHEASMARSQALTTTEVMKIGENDA